MFEALRWLSCVAIGLPCALCLFGNWLSLIGTLRTRKPTSMAMPFLAGPTCALACWLGPSATLRRFFWVPLVFDLSLLMLAGMVISSPLRWLRRPGSGEESPDS